MDENKQKRMAELSQKITSKTVTEEELIEWLQYFRELTEEFNNILKDVQKD